MPSVFLSHTSIDKSFVTKLATDLERLGIKVWFDKWEIKIGDSLTWKIEQGIRENEFLAIVLSPESVQSEWVKVELSSALVRQIQQRKVSLLPLLYRDCDIPLFLLDRRYADFRTDYQSGLRELCSVFNIRDVDSVSLDNWRIYAKNKKGNWQQFREEEFKQLVTVLTDLAVEYNWSAYTGASKSPYTICFGTGNDHRHNNPIFYVPIRLMSGVYSYKSSSLTDHGLPNDYAISDYDVYVGNSINECREFVWRSMEDYKTLHGNPKGKPKHFTSRFIGLDKQLLITRNMMKEMSWYQGEKFL